MSATITAFPRRPCRGWYLYERSPGVWVGHLHMGHGNVIERTREGPLWQVENIAKDDRYQMPIVRVPLVRGRGPETAA